MNDSIKYPILSPAGERIKIGVFGLGYVGLPLARLFSTRFPTRGYDINPDRVDAINAGHDSRLEVSDEMLHEALHKHGMICTADVEDMRDCNFYVVAVPTPIDGDNNPDLSPLIRTSELIGSVISKGDIVVFESTVYPGVTEEICIPVIEEVSGLQFNEDFFAGYSPERINPGDRLHTVEKIKKVTSGSTPQVADIVDEVYNTVLTNGTHKAPSIKVAEAAKVIENAQRDISIAFFNELAMIFQAMGIDTKDVIEAASSKWNFIKLFPGLVGGHCISVDPYYLINKAKEVGVDANLMATARAINEGMGKFVVSRVIDLMNRKGILVKNSRILILGVTFKENCPDIRNSKVASVFNAMNEYTDNIVVLDPWADPAATKRAYGIDIKSSLTEDMKGAFDAVILTVAHRDFSKLDAREFLEHPGDGVVYDVKGVLPSGMADERL